MYLRTTKRRNKDGSLVKYYQLAHNVRDPDTKQSKAEVIHNFGRADELDQSLLKRLCASIARICGLIVSDPVGDADRDPPRSDDFDLPKDLKLMHTVELGSVAVLEHLWEEFGIGHILRTITTKKKCKVPYERALLAMTANRLCEPESKLGIWDRWLKRVYLSDTRSLKLTHMYEAMDLLYEHSTEVEEAVFFKVADLINLQVDLIFYDTTSTSFAIDYEDPDDDENDIEGLRKLGHSKEGTWTPQVIVALAVTREGIPVRSWVFPGNTADVSTVEKVKADLKGWKLGRALFVADSGMNSDENREELGRACGKYLLATRVGSVKEIKEDVLSRPGRFRKIADNLHAKEVVVGDGVRARRYFLCYNPKQADREKEHREQVIKELKDHLTKHNDHSAKAQWAIELLASGRYKRYVMIDDTNQILLDKESIRNAERLDGKWVLISNDDTITVEDAATAYKSLLVIERCFRSLKKIQIKMGPMYHWLPHRIVAHVKICVMALLLERIAEIRSRHPWSKIRKVLRELQATEFHGPSHVFFRRNVPTEAMQQMLESLNIPMPKRILGVSELPIES